KLGVVVENFQYLDARQEGETRSLGPSRSQQPPLARVGSSSPATGHNRNGSDSIYGGGHYEDDGDYPPPSSKSNPPINGSDDDIPF
ncbi:MAG: hypothetical protein SNJ82_07780, partial [Gemmataceae bacterium]